MSEMIVTQNDLFRGQVFPKPPKAKLIFDARDREVTACPHCGKAVAIEECDVLGAEPNCVFCAHCSGEFEMA